MRFVSVAKAFDDATVASVGGKNYTPVRTGTTQALVPATNTAWLAAAMLATCSLRRFFDRQYVWCSSDDVEVC